MASPRNIYFKRTARYTYSSQTNRYSKIESLIRDMISRKFQFDLTEVV